MVERQTSKNGENFLGYSSYYSLNCTHKKSLDYKVI